MKEDEHDAYNFALRSLTRSAKTSLDLSRKLKQKGFNAQVIEFVLQRMKDLGYLDDEKYAQYFARQRFANKKYAKRRIAIEMKQKGFSDCSISQALGASELEDETAIAEQTAQKFVRKHGVPETDRDKAKFYRYMTRFGYGLDLIKQTLKRLYRG